jgi:hypothetical protein
MFNRQMLTIADRTASPLSPTFTSSFSKFFRPISASRSPSRTCIARSLISSRPRRIF